MGKALIELDDKSHFEAGGILVFCRKPDISETARLKDWAERKTLETKEAGNPDLKCGDGGLFTHDIIDESLPAHALEHGLAVEYAQKGFGGRTGANETRIGDRRLCTILITGESKPIEEKRISELIAEINALAS